MPPSSAFGTFSPRKKPRGEKDSRRRAWQGFKQILRNAGQRSFRNSTNSKWELLTASENSLMTTPLAQPAPPPLPGFALVVAPTVQFDAVCAEVHGSLRCRSCFAPEAIEIVGPSTTVPDLSFSV